MALQEANTLTDLARRIRDQARGLSIRADSMQAALFGSEPSAVPEDNAKLPELTVESLLREALGEMGEAETQLARTIARITHESGAQPSTYDETRAVAAGRYR